jgi:uncharacterized protein
MTRPKRFRLAAWGVALMVLLAGGWLVGALKLEPQAWRERLIEALPHRLLAWMRGVDIDHAVVIPMPDGKRLHASLYRPLWSREALPTVLIRLPYGRKDYLEAVHGAIFFARNGYAVLVQDLRGTGDSEGEFLPWRDAQQDGSSTLDWITRQPWSNGKVGAYGCSALGETQMVLSRTRNPALKAIIPSGAGGGIGAAAGRYSPFGVYEGGIFQLASGFGWFVRHGGRTPDSPKARPFNLAEHLRALPVSSLMSAVKDGPNAYDDYLATPLIDPKWSQWGFLTDNDLPAAAAMVINTWGDQTTGDALAVAEQWRRQGVRQNVVIAPGDHCQHEYSGSFTSFGDLTVAGGAFPWREWYLRLFDKWLKGRGEGLDKEAPYNYFMLVENRWRQADAWPPSQARVQRWYLQSDGAANTRQGNGQLSLSSPATDQLDAFTYDPRDPVPSRGGPVCCTGDPQTRPGPVEQAEVESRQDVLVYTSAPLEDDLRIAGPLHAKVTVSSSALDTDLVARLVHVWPDGRATSVQEGALRLRYREGLTRPRLLKPGEAVQVTVDMRSIAYLIPRGHRLRLQITSSCFPRLERNLNTGAPSNAHESRVVVAHNRIHHGPSGLSWLELPVLPPAH